MGTKGLGQYQLGLVAAQLIVTFAVLGLDKGFVRYLPMLEARKSDESSQLIMQGVVFSFLVSIALTCLLFLFSPILAARFYGSPEMAHVLRQFALYLPIITLIRISNGITNGLKRADVSTIIHNILSPILFLGLVVSIIYFDQGLSGAIFARQLSHFIVMIVSVVFIIRYFEFKSIKIFDLVQFKQLFAFSAPLLMIGIIYLLLGQMDVLMLGYFVKEQDVGTYSVAVRISGLIIIGLEIGLPIVGPYFSHFSESRDIKLISDIFKNSTKFISYLGLSIFLIIFVLRIELLSIFGTSFISGSSVLLILSCGHLSNAFTGPTGQLLVMTGKQKWEMTNSICVVIINFFLNIILIPKFGLTGAALATAISIIVINFAKLVEVMQIYRIHPYSLGYLSGIIAIFSAAAVTYFIRMKLIDSQLTIILTIVLSGIGFVIILSICFWLFGFSRKDKIFLKQILQKR